MTESNFARVFPGALELRRKEIGPDATLLDAATVWHRDMAARFEQDWLSSKNPIWVWRAIARLASLCVHASNLLPELKGRRFIEDLPPWCAEYLVESAYRIERLSALHDFRDSGESDRFHTVDGDLNPERAKDLLPSALQFTRQGWSAFKEYQSEDFLRFYINMMEINSEKFSIQNLMDIMGWVDERSARRRIAEIRSAVKPRGEV